MPATNAENVARLVQWEADLRYEARSLSVLNYRQLMDRCVKEFDPYWQDLCLPLLAFALLKNGRSSLASRVLEQLSDPLRSCLVGHPQFGQPDRGSLDEDPIRLRSRITLIEYAESRDLPDDRREDLWAQYHAAYTQDI